MAADEVLPRAYALILSSGTVLLTCTSFVFLHYMYYMLECIEHVHCKIDYYKTK